MPRPRRGPARRYAGLCRELTGWRNDPQTSWLSLAPVHPLQQALKDLERGWTNFFDGRTRPPRFRKRGRGDSFRCPDPKQVRLDRANGRIFLPKLGWLRYRNSRTAQGEVRTVTVSPRAGRWFVSVQTAREVPEPTAPAGSDADSGSGAVGLDLGVARLATLSDGTVLAPPDALRRYEKRLRVAQQALSRKQRGSRNRAKARLRVARLHARVADARADWLHKCSTAISKTHAVVCIEDLEVKAMTARARGTVEKPGSGVWRKSRRNRAILDRGWGEFRRQLDYKLAWAGGRLVAVDPHNTSHTCPACGHVAKENRPTRARFACTACGFAGDADLVAATNILRAGHARLACEVSAASSRTPGPRPGAARARRQQQEPAEATAAGSTR